MDFLAKWAEYIFKYFEFSKVWGYIVGYSLAHVGIYIGSFLLDRLLFGPYKTGKKSKQFLKHDFMCTFLELFNFRKAFANIITFGGIAYSYSQLRVGDQWDIFDKYPMLGLLSYFVCFDFLLYWYHRLSHLGPLWIQHSYHHSAEELNPLSDIRIHALSFPFLMITVLVPASFVYKVPPEYILPFFISLDILSICAHSRWNTGYGFIGRYLLVSPRHHRLHHSKTELKHSNFGTYLVFWDRLFGTYENSDNSFDTESGINNNHYASEGNSFIEYLSVFKHFGESIQKLLFKI